MDRGQELLSIHLRLGVVGWPGGANTPSEVQGNGGSCIEAGGRAPGCGAAAT